MKERDFAAHSKQLFQLLCHAEEMEQPTFQEKIAKGFEEAFSVAPSLSEEKKADILLQAFFTAFSTAAGFAPQSQWEASIGRLGLNKTQRKQFVASLLYSLYYGDLLLSQFLKQNARFNVGFFFLQVFAEIVPLRQLHSFLADLSADETLALILFCHLREREGGFLILSELGKLYPDSHAFGILMNRLDSRYFNAKKVAADVLEYPKKIGLKDLKAFLEKWESEAASESVEIADRLPVLLESILRSPDQVLDYVRSIQSENSIRAMAFENAMVSTHALHSMFAHCRKRVFSPGEIQKFVEVFGLSGHCPPLRFKGYWIEEDALIDKISFLIELFQRPDLLATIQQQELQEMLNFVYELTLHLATFHDHPEEYLQGNELITYAIPTSGKDLSRLAWLPSVAKGLKTLFSHLPQSALKDCPVFIFDQSPPALLRKNKAFINSVCRATGCHAVLITAKEAMSLARKLGVESLIHSKSEKGFGYGGARNAVYFLSPVFRAAFKQGKKTVSSVISSSKAWLRQLFEAQVLNGIHTVVAMGDDDMLIPASNLFSDALFARRFANQYFTLRYYYIGRKTDAFNSTLTLDKLIERPFLAYRFVAWSSLVNLGGLNGALSKPKFSLNLPFPCEEQYFRSLKLYAEMFRLPWVHFGGNRFPLTQLPTKSFVGLSDHLAWYIPYVFHIILAQWLAYSEKDEPPVLPWNEGKFHSLREVLELASQSKTEMQRAFWIKLKQLFSNDKISSSLLRSTIDSISQVSVEETLADYRKRHSLTQIENRELKRIGDVYEAYQQDIEILRELCSKLSRVMEKGNLKNAEKAMEKVQKDLEKKHGIRLAKLPLTSGMLRVIQILGTGEFCSSLQQVLTS